MAYIDTDLEVRSSYKANQIPSVNEVYNGALAEHAEFADFDDIELKEIIYGALQRVVEFERKSRESLDISREEAENIGTVWIFSGTGSYDEPFKAKDNPSLMTKAWMGGFDRKRIDRGVYLVRKIAEIRSGQDASKGSIANHQVRKEQTKELIAEYGPTIVYNGYPADTEFAESLLDRIGGIIPREKVKIIHGDLKVTTDQVKTFDYPDGREARDKEIVVVSHAPHLATRVLHIANLYKPFVDDAIPYLFPVPSPENGRREFALMEIRGLLYYIYMKNDASKDPHPYKLI